MDITSSQPANERRICDVCRLVDGDMSLKEGFFCPLCDSWICFNDQWRFDRRANAAIRRKFEFSYKGRHDAI